MEEELAQLKDSMAALRAEKEKLAYELRTKDDKLQSLVKDCKNLVSQCDDVLGTFSCHTYM